VRWNVGMTAALTELHRTGRVGDTLRFYRSPAGVLLGQHQNRHRAVNVSRCLRKNIEIARRITGGTAVYLNSGILAFDLVLDLREFGTRLSNAIAWVATSVAVGVTRIGLPARFQPSGGVVVDGQRIANITGTQDAMTLVFQGFVHLQLDTAARIDALTAPGRQKADAELARLTERSAGLSDFLGRVPSAEEIADALAAGMSNELRLQSVRGEANLAEIKLAAHHAEGADGREVLADRDESEGTFRVGRRKVESGTVEAYVRLTTGDEKLVDLVRIAGDFSMSPTHAVQDLERALRGVSADAAADHAHEMLQTSAVTIFGVAPADIAAAIGAAVRAKPTRVLRSP
jgi:lipoate-protein ligase A